MVIPKTPKAPIFSIVETRHITEIVFGDEDEPTHSDAIFLFGGTHPGLWKTALQIYRLRLAPLLFVSGGTSGRSQKHSEWQHGETPESTVLQQVLMSHGVPEDSIIVETQSGNSYENVSYLKSAILEKQIQSIITISKNYAVGRQKRTFQKQMTTINVTSLGFETEVSGEAGVITRDNWITKRHWRDRVFGEYLRNVLYGLQGHIIHDFNIPNILKEKVSRYIHLD